MLVGVVAVRLSVSVYPQQQAPVTEISTAQQAIVARYCITCHNERSRTGGLSLEKTDIANVGAAAEVWEKVVQKLHGNLMPPPGRPRPDQASFNGLITYLETSLDRAAELNPNPGRTEALHRLNRTEYRNAIRDLLLLDIDVGSMLPADDVSYGFDNIAGVQRMSPTLMERYLAAAQKISAVAVGASARAATTETFLVPPDLRQDDRLEGLPFGSRGGTLIRHNFPRDGTYSVRVQLTRYLGASFDEIPAFDQPQRLEVSLDGTPVHVFELNTATKEGRGYAGPNRRGLDAEWQVRFPAKAGPREVALTFLNRTPALLENLLEPFEKPTPGGPNGYYTTQKGAYLRSIEISGPYEASGVGDTPSRRQIFVCRPRSADSREQTGCAKKILLTLARRAFRRPVTDADIGTLLTLVQRGEGSARFRSRHRAGGRRATCQPRIPVSRSSGSPAIPRVPQVPVPSVPVRACIESPIWSWLLACPSFSGAVFLMTRCSTRRRRANCGTRQCSTRQVRRMLADPRADALVTNFVGQWLFLRNLPTLLPDPKRELDFNEDLRQGFRRETELFTGSILREDRSVLELLTANYTFVNEPLAMHYGIPHIRGAHFRRVERDDERRRGILGHGSVLAVTSFPHRTSPVVRGKWILENLLGTQVPPPPPDVPVLRGEAEPGRGTCIDARAYRHASRRIRRAQAATR